MLNAINNKGRRTIRRPLFIGYKAGFFLSNLLSEKLCVSIKTGKYVQKKDKKGKKSAYFKKSGVLLPTPARLMRIIAKWARCWVAHFLISHHPASPGGVFS